jgi:hypothetical protein
MSELLCCPFCGGTAVFYPTNEAEKYYSQTGWLIGCETTGCGVSMQDDCDYSGCGEYDVTEENLQRCKEEVSRMWNRRAT